MARSVGHEVTTRAVPPRVSAQTLKEDQDVGTSPVRAAVRGIVPLVPGGWSPVVTWIRM